MFTSSTSSSARLHVISIKAKMMIMFVDDDNRHEIEDEMKMLNAMFEAKMWRINVIVKGIYLVMSASSIGGSWK